MEWDGDEVTFSNVTATPTNNYTTWPYQNTVTYNADDQSIFMSGALGPRVQLL